MAGSRVGIAERRLRPLWDAIDTRNYKPALKLATALLAKHPDSAYLLALKALVLERIGKPDEALVCCNQAKDARPSDDLTLNTLQMVYQRLKLLDQATICYEYACSKVPNNLELLVSLFKCYVREYAFVKQQLTAMKLYKLIGEEKFLLWAVCSVLMQVGIGDGGSRKLVALAEGLLKKRVETHGLQDLEALMLYISVLQQQEKYDSALEILSGKLGALFSIQNDKLRLQGELLMRLHNFGQAAEVFKDILMTSSDDWAVFISYLDASLEGAQISGGESSDFGNNSSVSLEEDEVDNRLNTVMKLVMELQGAPMEELRRAPFLAVIEIEKRRLLFKRKTAGQQQLREQSSVLADSILAYFKRFGYLLSFSSDMAGFVEYVDEDHKEYLSSALHEASIQVESEGSVKRLRRKISAFQVEEQLRIKSTATDTDVALHAIEIVKLYVESLELSTDLDAQESMHGEELLVLATNLLIELFRRTQQIGFLLEAILVLEFGLFARRYSAQYKLILIDLYTMVSSVIPALEWYRTLDVKYILVETLSHCILPGLLGSTCWSDLKNLLSDSIRFYDNHQRESADLTVLAYEQCTYSKVLEFVEFKERIGRSHQRLVFRIESAILSLKEKAENLEEVESALVDLEFGRRPMQWCTEEQLRSLSFNEDLQIRPWWSPAPDECYLTGRLREVGGERSWHHIEKMEDQRKRESRWCNHVKRRCLLPRILCLLLSSIKERSESEQSYSDTSFTELKKLLDDYFSTLGLQWDKFQDWINDAISSERLMLEESGVDAVEMMTATVFWTTYHLSAKSSETTSCVLPMVIQVMEYVLENLLRNVTRNLFDNESGSEEAGIKVIAPGKGLSYLVRLTSESLVWLTLYMQAWAKLLQPSGKKKKKPPGSLDQNETAVESNLSGNLESLRIACVAALNKLQGWLLEYLNRPDHVEVDAFLSIICGESEAPDGSPGSVIRVLELGLSTATQLAARTPQTKQPWDIVSHLREMVRSQRQTLVGIQDLCTLRLKTLRSFKF